MASVHAKIVARLEGKPPPPPEPGDVFIPLTDEEAKWLKDLAENYLQHAGRFRTMLLDMALVNLVALLDAFLADSFTAVLAARPEMLRSRQRQLSYETVLSFDDYEQLTTHMAQREIGGTSYKSMPDQLAYYKQRFNVDLEQTEDVSVPDLVEAVARRNLLLHNNGVVNLTYLALVPQARASIGDTLEVDDAYWERAAENIPRAAREVGSALRVHFAPAGKRTK
jgi:hypothetical protein